MPKSKFSDQCPDNMAFIPAGVFMAGEVKDLSEMYIDTFCMDKYEVTQWDERGDYSWDSLLNGRLPMVRKAVSMVTSKAQENIFAWMTRDEPNENMYNMVKAYHDIIHELDPYHPTWIPFAQSYFPPIVMR